MGILNKRTLIPLYLALLELVSASLAFAADQVAPQPYPWPWWREMYWSGFGWIFPLICFAIMIVIFLFAMRRGGMGCVWHGRLTDRSDLRDSMQRSWSRQSASALEILNGRYAAGEIDKQEYEEKKAAIVSTR
jgi:uncharacterized membrane protein